MPHEKPNILGADAVVALLGQWPSFHDAEIVRLHLERDGSSTVSIQLVGPGGGCKDGRVVTFTMEHINDLSLDGKDINVQNVIFDLSIESTEKGTRLTFAPCYGLTGRITPKECTLRCIKTDPMPQRIR